MIPLPASSAYARAGTSFRKGDRGAGKDRFLKVPFEKVDLGGF